MSNEFGQDAAADALRIGGFVPLSTVDFPDMLAAVAFCQGCPWRCRYCHNPHLIPAEGEGALSWPGVREFLQQRRGLLDAVVFSGGEPGFQKALLPALREVKALGFKAALHTGGAYPELLAELLPELDWVGFDVKALANDYPTITGVPRSGVKNWQSLIRLLDSGVAFECRTTVHKALMSLSHLRMLAIQLAHVGVSHYAVQPVRAGGWCDPGLPDSIWTQRDTEFVQREIAPLFEHFQLRR